MRHALGHSGVLPALVLLCGMAVAEEGGALLPVIPLPAEGGECVEPTDVMRRDHMRFLTHQRDETVHQGIRRSKHSLVGCVECHARKDAEDAAVSVNAEGQFCESCHSYVGVRIDCFGCHAAVPAEERAAGALSQRMSLSAVSVADAVSPGAD